MNVAIRNAKKLLAQRMAEALLADPQVSADWMVYCALDAAGAAPGSGSRAPTQLNLRLASSIEAAPDVMGLERANPESNRVDSLDGDEPGPDGATGPGTIICIFPQFLPSTFDVGPSVSGEVPRPPTGARAGGPGPTADWPVTPRRPPIAIERASASRQIAS